jgi:hypothetical protein
MCGGTGATALTTGPVPRAMAMLRACSCMRPLTAAAASGPRSPCKPALTRRCVLQTWPTCNLLTQLAARMRSAKRAPSRRAQASAAATPCAAVWRDFANDGGVPLTALGGGADGAVAVVAHDGRAQVPRAVQPQLVLPPCTPRGAARQPTPS